VEKLKKT